MQIHKRKDIELTIKMNEEEAQCIAGACERLLLNWNKNFTDDIVEIFVTTPSTGKNKRVRMDKHTVKKIADHFNFMIEGL